jgi:hypothetical protein
MLRWTRENTSGRHPTENFPEAEWDRIVGLNLKGSFLTARCSGGSCSTSTATVSSTSRRSLLCGLSAHHRVSPGKGGVAQLTPKPRHRVDRPRHPGSTRWHRPFSTRRVSTAWSIEILRQGAAVRWVPGVDAWQADCVAALAGFEQPDASPNMALRSLRLISSSTSTTSNDARLTGRSGYVSRHRSPRTATPTSAVKPQ